MRSKERPVVFSERIVARSETLISHKEKLLSRDGNYSRQNRPEFIVYAHHFSISLCAYAGAKKSADILDFPRTCKKKKKKSFPEIAMR